MEINRQINDFFLTIINSSINENPYIYWLVIVGLICISCFLSYLFVRYLIIRFLHIALKRTKNKWDDVLIDRKVFVPLALLAPAITFNYIARLVPGFPQSLLGLVYPFVVIDIAFVIERLLSAALDIYNMHPISWRWPLKGYVQIVKLVLFLAVGIIIVCYFLGLSPVGLLSGLGAMTALILLIFKDTILSFVASIQIVTNDLVRVGDWIEMPQCNADGDVIEIALYTIKVQNWDKTITTIPTYKLIQESFKNWRGMKLARGRRIKRAILIDQTSVRFLDKETINRLKKIQILKEYIEKKEKELEEYNKAHNIDDSVLVNGRRMTNLGTFRAYLTHYLKNHPRVRKDLTFMVRQLAPTPEGLPLEVYAFSSDTNWIRYEGIQADIFDHILACIPEFGLRVYQKPSGHDFEKFCFKTKPEKHS